MPSTITGCTRGIDISDNFLCRWPAADGICGDLNDGVATKGKDDLEESTDCLELSSSLSPSFNTRLRSREGRNHQSQVLV